MSHLVAVTLRRATGPSVSHPTAPSRRTYALRALTVQGTSAGRVYAFTAMAGVVDAVRASATDEHFAADADRERRRLSCADVLFASRLRPLATAVRWLMHVTAAYPGCRLAAAPLTEGGWAILDRASRQPVVLALRVPGDQPLLASCLHTWLVAGHDVRILEDVRVVHATYGSGPIG
ncbi:hypothetical protein QF026_002017 [Streptomyces aurantiacus]|uniref:hypothetical protein n=1 Tax=Streptomyces aurantiacus TaxID=47760 RepID=UPI00278E1D9D|nr:hypothetical protein [Streptomyces aurantiacus]MDQ0773551.1 hypothetical protein [Streptomyces aurantiacus]